MTDQPFTRDTSTLPEDGPQATQFESDMSRQTEAPQNINGGQQPDAVITQRPRFSPVAQPGMVEEIHWHTVKSEQRAPAAEEPPRRRRRRRGKGRGRQGG